MIQASFSGKKGTQPYEKPLRFECKRCGKSFGFPKKMDGKFYCPYCCTEMKKTT